MDKLALRRLALRARRDPSLLPVLHDALLEAFPEEYRAKIDFAERSAVSERRFYLIVFNPEMLVAKSPRGRRLHSWGNRRFAVFELSIDQEEDNPIGHAIARVVMNVRARDPVATGSIVPTYVARPRRISP